ncbi:MAG TPA: hypothetical protein PK798_12490, partial [Flavobacteriales bacterium]|nr:hypothetical protein [Flavobacteriales bacterium]
YTFYLEADRLSLGRQRTLVFSLDWLKEQIFRDRIYRFQRLLRKVEYYQNCKKHTFIGQLIFLFLYRKFLNESIRLGFSIHPNNFGPGLAIAHYGTIVVNQSARIGANCRIHVDVNIGTEAGFSDKAPHIGDNIYIGPGAKIFGSIRIADGCVIGANSVVNNNFDLPGKLILGVPAKDHGDVDSTKYLRQGTTGVGDPLWDELNGLTGNEIKSALNE